MARFDISHHTMTNKSYPGLSPSNYPVAPLHGTITHVTLDRVTGCVTAIGLDGERLDSSLGQQHSVPLGVIPEIGKPLNGVALERSSHSGGVL